MNRNLILLLLLDVFIVFVAIALTIWLLPVTLIELQRLYVSPVAYFIILWFLGSCITQKCNFKKYTNYKAVFYNILWSNLFILMVTSLMLFFLKLEFLPEILIGTILLATIEEWFIGYLFLLGIKTHPSIDEDTIGISSFTNGIGSETIIDIQNDPELVKNITNLAGETAKNFILDNIAHLNLLDTLFISTTTRFNIDNQGGPYQNIVNLKRINDILRINKFFESVNQKLPKGGIYIDFVETYILRKQRILGKYIWGFNYVVYSIDFVFKRIFPKLIFTKGIYFYLTKGQNRVMSKAETFGRLYSCGFRLYSEKQIGNYLYFAAQKIKDPVYDLNPTYGPFIKLRRIGQYGKLFNVYKLRTMHPYAEYLQSYIHEKYNLDKGGKFKNDFRVNSLGRFFRKFWIDELPMLVNLLEGDLKLVGVRPLSQHYFNLYSKELQQERIKYKPGLIPPYYADMPKTMEEIQATEMKYLKMYAKSPFLTDFKYFFMAFNNIIFKRARSK